MVHFLLVKHPFIVERSSLLLGLVLSVSLSHLASLDSVAVGTIFTCSCLAGDLQYPLPHWPTVRH